MKSRKGSTTNRRLAAALLSAGALSLPGLAQAADCPAVTAADNKGISGTFPNQFDLAEFQAKASCTLALKDNPAIGALNGRIAGNPASLPGVAERLPAEPLVVAPYDSIGSYGGVLSGLSKATEAGTSDLLSVRHVNLARFNDDLQTLVPNIAKSWEWNADFTELTIKLRKGHKWSDGAPFTAEDVAFWYNGLINNRSIYKEIPDRFSVAGKPFEVTAADDVTVKIKLSAPKPGLMYVFAVDYAQAFQPKHFFQRWHPDYNPDAEKNAKADGFDNWVDAVNFYYGGSDWTDVPSPLLKDPAKAQKIGRAVRPSLESHVLVEETTEGRRLVANPYFHMVDTAGHQLPYIDEIAELYVPEEEIQNLKLSNGEVTYKAQAVSIASLPVLQANEQKGGYAVDLVPSSGQMVVYGVNVTSKDEGLRKIFNDIRFRKAMSLALDREEINELVYFGQGRPMQYTIVEPSTVSYVTDEQSRYLTEFDPDQAKALLDEMGLADKDGDGKRERPDGSKLVLNLDFATQGGPPRGHELAAQYWGDVGLDVRLKEVTSDEYRASQAANDLDIITWQKTYPSVTLANDRQPFLPVFGDYFNATLGHEWLKWMQTGGTQGIEPPAAVGELDKLSAEYQKFPLGSDRSNALGQQIVKLWLDNLWFIGTVGESAEPVYHRNDLGNFRKYTLKTYDYYWAYAYRPQQWFLKK
ncbi:MAG: ABC transporter substrate-binding protein [Ectothiorhodospiraceae bacterium]|nr:ABC transporter substrate-binding protein [Chromatiales bacterium]MCP5154942.1 ABC transporter substrate-binding protein [Ectothiorhodospiraceae bacterium]